MTEPTSDQDSAHDKSDVPEADIILAGLIELVNRSPGTELGVTLHVNGTVLSGLLISGQSFIDRQMEVLTEAGKGSAALAPYFDIFRSIYSDNVDNDQPLLTPPLPAYVHLRSASIIEAGSNQVTFPLWRGRLSEISGWSIGNIGKIE